MTVLSKRTLGVIILARLDVVMIPYDWSRICDNTMTDKFGVLTHALRNVLLRIYARLAIEAQPCILNLTHILKVANLLSISYVGDRDGRGVVVNSISLTASAAVEFSL